MSDDANGTFELGHLVALARAHRTEVAGEDVRARYRAFLARAHAAGELRHVSPQHLNHPRPLSDEARPVRRGLPAARSGA
jgi:hypothetical protein